MTALDTATDTDRAFWSGVLATGGSTTIPRWSLAPAPGTAVVEVADRGPGVAPADRDRIFDRFYRAPARRATPGAGLGLPIARATAERWGGSVRLLPSDAGARFEVRLPLAEDP